MRTVREGVILLLLCSAAGQAWALDRKEVDKIVADHMSKIRTTVGMPYINPEISALEPHLLLDALKPYQEDESEVVRSTAYDIAWVVGRDSKDPAIRQEVVTRLLTGRDAWARNSHSVLSFRRADFTDEAKQIVRALMQKDTPSSDIVLVAGIAEVQEAIPKLKALAGGDWRERPAWYRTTGWDALRALARMGDKNAIQECVEKVKTNPEVWLLGAMLNDLEYIRQPEAVALIVKYLNSDEMMPRPDGRPGGARFSMSALLQLCRMIKDFPVRDNGTGFYADADVESARTWMREHKDYEIIR